jgi:2-polyprenyl-3-methyl-5-hydroxy-6-metoxy-1,4-benzoquinol methylase
MHPNSDSRTNWDEQSQREFWNFWDSHYLQEETLGSDARHRGAVVLSLLRNLPVRNPHIIEVGCGNGWLAEKLAAFGDVTGVDISDLAIAEARRRSPNCAFHCGNILAIDPPARDFDVAITLETFSHVTDQALFVARISGILKKGGYLILATQNRFVYLRRGDVAPPAEGQLRRWVTMRELRKILRPHFTVSKAFTIEPSGDRGLLRVVNSKKLNRYLTTLIPPENLKRFKERCGLGQTLVVVAQKP